MKTCPFTGDTAMLVQDWMTRTVITVDVNTSMQDAMNLLKKNEIRMLPVTKGGNLVGIVTDRDLKKAQASDATTLEIHELLYLISKIKVKDIMSEPPITVPIDFTVEETVKQLLENKISGAPVVDSSGRIVGAITQTDLFNSMISLTGVGMESIQVAMQLEDRPGAIKEVSDIVRQFGGRTVSVLSSSGRAPKGYFKAYIRFHSIERSEMNQLIEKLKKKGHLLYLVDYFENKREIHYF